METETVAHSPVDDDLHLLTAWGAAGDRGRERSAGIASILVHIAAVTTIALLPPSVIERAHQTAHLITPLIAPLTEPTQTTPNKRKISKEFDAEEMTPRPRIQIPPSPPSTTRPAAAQPSLPAPTPTPAPRNVPQPTLPEPPKMEATLREPPKLDAGTSPVPLPPVPQIQAQEVKPKIAFENPASQVPAPPAPTGRVAVPNPSVAEAMRGVVRGGSSGGLALGDPGAGIGGIGEGINLPPSPGRQGSSLELLSDPMGVDFRPYLVQILAAVRRNWWAVMPEAARLGRRGKVAIQFAVARDGSVPKLRIVSNSGTDALDRAAVAGISASNPFPPLPREFKGDQIRLQFNFAYNMQR
jgi:TonB family protein